MGALHGRQIQPDDHHVDRTHEDLLEQPSYTGGELWLTRGFCLAIAFVVFVTSIVAIRTGAAIWLWLYAAGFAVMIVATVLVAQVPRRIQKQRDGEWAARFHEMAIRDDLTGLYNRRYFNTALERALSRAPAGVAVAAIDLDDFKRINDSLGHAAGDVALRVTAAALKAAAPRGLVARIGGDEFAVLMTDITAVSLASLADDLERAIRVAPFFVEEGTDVSLSGSVGIAALKVGSDAEELLRAADRSLYRAKQAHALRHERRAAS